MDDSTLTETTRHKEVGTLSASHVDSSGLYFIPQSSPSTIPRSKGGGGGGSSRNNRHSIHTTNNNHNASSTRSQISSVCTSASSHGESSSHASSGRHLINDLV